MEPKRVVNFMMNVLIEDRTWSHCNLRDPYPSHKRRPIYSIKSRTVIRDHRSPGLALTSMKTSGAKKNSYRKWMKMLRIAKESSNLSI